MEHFGKYRILSKIADGGMAEVFLAVTDNLGGTVDGSPDAPTAHSVGGFLKRVAIKRILPSYSSDASFVSSFVNEARICGHLTHPNLVQVYDFDKIALREGERTNVYLYLAMEFIEGLDLERIITHRLLSRKLIPPAIAVEIVLQMLDGLQHAHFAVDAEGHPLNVIHRDLKPSNVLIDRSGVIKIVDFGVAKASTNVNKTINVGTAKGTVSYMSPEQAAGRIDLTAASDLFGVAAILYELLSLRRLFDGDNLFVILDEVRNAPIEERLAKLPPLPDGLVSVIRKGLIRDPKERFSSAKAMSSALRAVIPLLDKAESLAAFVEELVSEGMTIAGLSEPQADSAPTGSYTPAFETRPDHPAMDSDLGVPLRRSEIVPNARNLANLALESGAPFAQGVSPPLEERFEQPTHPPSGAPIHPGAKTPRAPEDFDILRSVSLSQQGAHATPHPSREQPLPPSLRPPIPVLPQPIDETETTPVTRGRAVIQAGTAASSAVEAAQGALPTGSNPSPSFTGGQPHQPDSRLSLGLPAYQNQFTAAPSPTERPPMESDGWGSSGDAYSSGDPSASPASSPSQASPYGYPPLQPGTQAAPAIQDFLPVSPQGDPQQRGTSPAWDPSFCQGPQSAPAWPPPEPGWAAVPSGVPVWPPPTAPATSWDSLGDPDWLRSQQNIRRPDWPSPLSPQPSPLPPIPEGQAQSFFEVSQPTQPARRRRPGESLYVELHPEEEEEDNDTAESGEGRSSMLGRLVRWSIIVAVMASAYYLIF